MFKESAAILTVDVWNINIETISTFGEIAAKNIFSEEELAQARRFRFAEDTRRFLSRRWALRKILSQYYSRPPGKLTFSTNENGKPWIDCNENLSVPWKFNFSHSGDIAMLALVREQEIGIDVEYTLKPMPDLYEVLRVVCRPIEVRQFQALPQAWHQQAFYKIWTTKEAYLKALGTGLSREPDTVHLKIGGTGKDVVLTFDDSEERGWQFVSLVPRRDYLATLALRSDRKIEINHFSFPDS